ncbi:MAG: BamA/TamA family outer membrane protein [Altererythrobacter sp.]|nr:BamA/TamA family outer membrane protein [Altererythrobacter sp.]
MYLRSSFVLAAILLLAVSRPVLGQSEDAARKLEDLIPDDAVSMPENWAVNGDPGVQGEGPEVAVDPPFGEDSLNPPDLDIDASRPASSQRSEDDPFASIDDLPLPPTPELGAVRIDSRLELAFPVELMSRRDGTNFIGRFRALRAARDINPELDNVALRAAHIRADRELLQDLLRADGYYDARVWRQFGEELNEDTGASDELVVRFGILPGEPYRFGSIDLGGLQAAPDYRRLRETFGIVSGDPIRSDRIVEQREALATELLETGYPFSMIEDPELLIDHDRGEGDLTMPVEPGGKYSFGQVTSNMPDFLSAKHISGIARFEPGDIYQRSLETDLRRALLATGIVSSVTITPRPVSEPVDGKPGELEMDVEIEKGRLRTIAGAVGYGTEDGLKLQASWEHRNLFPSEGTLRLRGVVGTRELSAGIGIQKNNFRGRDQLLALDVYASDTKSEAVEARTVGIRASFGRISNILFQKEFSWQLGAGALFTDERNRAIGGIPRLRQEYLIGALFGRVAYDGSDAFLDPTRGFRAGLAVTPEVSRDLGEFGRDEFYTRIETDGTAYLPAATGVTLAARGKFATIVGAKPFRIAPSRRIYAGGGSSVRGYGYQAVGPRNDFGEPTGGASLVELSVEARVDTGFLDGALQVVPFFDLGTVSRQSTPDFRFVQYGAGVGIRYKTGFGPIRVDVGVPLNRNPLFDSPVAVYVSLGQAF